MAPASGIEVAFGTTFFKVKNVLVVTVLDSTLGISQRTSEGSATFMWLSVEQRTMLDMFSFSSTCEFCRHKIYLLKDAPHKWCSKVGKLAYDMECKERTLGTEHVARGGAYHLEGSD